MKACEALKLSKRIARPWTKVAVMDLTGHDLIWEESGESVGYSNIIEDDWFAVKCDACKRADELQDEYDDCIPVGAKIVYDHLTTPWPIGHCVCQKKIRRLLCL